LKSSYNINSQAQNESKLSIPFIGIFILKLICFLASSAFPRLFQALPEGLFDYQLIAKAFIKIIEN